MANDYHKMIKALFGFRDRLEVLLNKKNERLIDYLKKKEFDVRNDDQVYPDINEIALSTELSKPKLRNLIKELYINLIDFFSDNSFTLKENFQVLYIHFPYDEEDTIHKNYREEAKRMSLWIQVQLPVIPRLGEEISLDFIDRDVRYNHGYVTEISHEISCIQQRTIIHIHPIRNYFHQWEKMRIKHNST